MKIYPYRRGHMNNLLLQPSQEYLRPWVEAGCAAQYENAYSFSLLDDDGKTLACAGLTECWEGRATAWAILSEKIGKRGMLVVTRAIQRELDTTLYDRIEAYVDAEFDQGNSWVKFLGFENETPQGMRKFINGRTHYLYSRVK